MALGQQPGEAGPSRLNAFGGSPLATMQTGSPSPFGLAGTQMAGGGLSSLSSQSSQMQQLPFTSTAAIADAMAAMSGSGMLLSNPAMPSNGQNSFLATSMPLAPLDSADLTSVLSTWTTPASSLPVQAPLTPMSDVDAPWSALVVLMPRDNLAVTPRSREFLHDLVEPVANRILEVLAASAEPASSISSKGKGKASASASKPYLKIGAVLYGTRRSSKAKRSDAPLDRLLEPRTYPTAALGRIPLMPADAFLQQMRDPGLRMRQLDEGAFARGKHLTANAHMDSLLMDMDGDDELGMEAELEERWWANADAKNPPSDQDGLLLGEGLVAALEMLPDDSREPSHPFSERRSPPASLYLLNILPTTTAPADARHGPVGWDGRLSVSSLPALRNQQSIYDNWTWTQAAAEMVARGVYVSTVLVDADDPSVEEALKKAVIAGQAGGLPGSSLPGKVHAALVGLDAGMGAAVTPVPCDPPASIFSPGDEKQATLPERCAFAFAGFSAATKNLGSGSHKCRRHLKANQNLLDATGAGSVERRASITAQSTGPASLPAAIPTANGAAAATTLPARPPQAGAPLNLPDPRVVQQALVKAMEAKVPGVTGPLLQRFGFLIQSLASMSKTATALVNAKRAIQQHPAPINNAPQWLLTAPLPLLEGFKSQIATLQARVYQQAFFFAKGQGSESNLINVAQSIMALEQQARGSGIRLGGLMDKQQQQQQQSQQQQQQQGQGQAHGQPQQAQPRPAGMPSQQPPLATHQPVQPPAALPTTAGAAPTPARNKVLWEGTISWSIQDPNAPNGRREIVTTVTATCMNDVQAQALMLPWPASLTLSAVSPVNQTQLRSIASKSIPAILFTPITTPPTAPDAAKRTATNILTYQQLAKALEAKKSAAFVKHGGNTTGFLLMATLSNSSSGGNPTAKLLGLLFSEPIPFDKILVPATKHPAQPAPPAVPPQPAPQAASLPPTHDSSAGMGQPSSQPQANWSGPAPQPTQPQFSPEIIQQLMRAQSGAAPAPQPAQPPAQLPAGLNPAALMQMDQATQARLFAAMQSAAAARGAGTAPAPSAQMPSFGQQDLSSLLTGSLDSSQMQIPGLMQQQQQQALLQQQQQKAHMPAFTSPFGVPNPPVQPSMHGSTAGIDMAVLAQMLQQQQQQQRR